MDGYRWVRYGTMEGRPALVVDGRAVDWTDEDALALAVMERRVPGIGAIVLENVLWSDPHIGRAVFRCRSHPSIAHIPVVGEKGLRSQGWSSGDVWWIVDASELLRHATESAHVIHELQGLPYIPRPTDLVLKFPHHANLSATVLDEIYTRLDPVQAWMYMTEDTFDLVLPAVCKAATPWTVRRCEP